MIRLTTKSINRPSWHYPGPYNKLSRVTNQFSSYQSDSLRFPRIGRMMDLNWLTNRSAEWIHMDQWKKAVINCSASFALCQPLGHVWRIHNAHFTASYSKLQWIQYKLLWPQYHRENQIFWMTWMLTKFPVFQIVLNVTQRISFLEVFPFLANWNIKLAISLSYRPVAFLFPSMVASRNLSY